MKIKSVSAYTLFVKDLDASVKFYEMLGFDFKVRQDDRAVGYVNWFSVTFLPIDQATAEFQKEAQAEPKGSGVYFYLSVDDVDQAYKDLVDAGVTPSTEPRDWPWGNREFVVRDPDRYKLVMFKKK